MKYNRRSLLTCEQMDKYKEDEFISIHQLLSLSMSYMYMVLNKSHSDV